MDEQPKNNDTFTIRPPDWRFRAWPPSWFWQACVGRVYWVASTLKDPGWAWRINDGETMAADSKESAMAACEQHWRSELLPALIPVESAKEASV